MRHGRWLVALLGVAVTVSLAAGPAGAVSSPVASGDQAILNAGVIMANDVPATWTAAKPAAPSTRAYKGIAECKAISASATVAHGVPHKQSPQFSDPSDQYNTYAADTVYTFKTAAAVNKYLVPFQASSAPSCLQKSLQKQLGSQDQVSAGQAISNLQGIGDTAVGYEFRVQATVQTSQMTYIFDVIGVRIGRAFIGFTFTNPNVSIPQGPAIVNAVISRVQSTAGG